MENGGNGGGNGGQPPVGEAGNDPFDVLDFPCRFEIKAMGRDDNRFNALVQGIVTRHIRQEDLLNIKVRPSREGRYVSITVIIRAISKEQIRAIYAGLAACPEVLMTL
jgi:putative lipoic acid-binding regulatory protein